jgi:hypothetical protein
MVSYPKFIDTWQIENKNPRVAVYSIIEEIQTLIKTLLVKMEKLA